MFDLKTTYPLRVWVGGAVFRLVETLPGLRRLLSSPKIANTSTVAGNDSVHFATADGINRKLDGVAGRVFGDIEEGLDRMGEQSSAKRGARIFRGDLLQFRSFIWWEDDSTLLSVREDGARHGTSKLIPQEQEGTPLPSM